MTITDKMVATLKERYKKYVKLMRLTTFGATVTLIVVLFTQKDILNGVSMLKINPISWMYLLEAAGFSCIGMYSMLKITLIEKSLKRMGVRVD